MTSSKSSGSFRPFKDLDKLIRNQSVALPPSNSDTLISPVRIKASFNRDGKNESHNRYSENDSVFYMDKHIFLEAMSDVEPILTPSHRFKLHKKPSCNSYQETESRDLAADTCLQLVNLIKNGEGFIVEHTPEYREWSGFNVNPQIAKRLHRGDFTIQEYIDLHGLNVMDAKVAFDMFLRESIETSKHAVLIVHGRGLSSPSDPVLKSKVYEWLTSGQWNKWVVAFASARLCDGGAGATYVLLRRHPLSKRFKKAKKKMLDKSALIP